MIIVPYQPEHLLKLQLQDGQAFFQEAITPALAQSIAGPFVFSAFIDERPVAVFGVSELWENRGIAWSFISADAGPQFATLHKAAVRLLNLVPFRRVEADTPCEFTQGHRWLRMLGFELEAERMVAHRPDGGDSALYAKVKPWY